METVKKVQSLGPVFGGSGKGVEKVGTLQHRHRAGRLD